MHYFSSLYIFKIINEQLRAITVCSLFFPGRKIIMYTFGPNIANNITRLFIDTPRQYSASLKTISVDVLATNVLICFYDTTIVIVKL